MEKFSLITYGCKLNQADSELILGLLSESFQKTSENETDFVIINSCGVVEKTERKIKKKIEELKKKNKKIILAGCLPLISKDIIKKVDGVLGPKNLLHIKEAIEEIKKGKKPIYLEEENLNKSKYCRVKVRLQKNSCIVIVPISEGCLGRCAYCATKLARGKLKSFSIEGILEEVKFALSLGFREIHLTSQDIACFGLDYGEYQLPKLLEKIISLPFEFRIRLGMGNPQHFKQILNSLIEVYKSEKIYKYLHIPVQSGSDRILKEMKRGYRVRDFLEVVEAFKKEFPDLMLVTDVIVGWPEEKNSDFQKTVELIEKIKPRIINITKFSKRPNTEAERLKDLPDRIKTKRSRILDELSKKIKEKDGKGFVGRLEEVLVTKKGKKETYLARPPHFRAVILKNAKIGEFLKVKIKEVSVNYLLGEILQPN
ncbi:MAG: tRNA (N(6)-L-threonylcarbamoyladenosine(37)-C(2))-methylthiotransferase [Candidatus Pacebacteria bacterium]|nr:tRNA (N(6)-L-threonylcarbamoyladenosine(37)-C(2))-methylthiotransferase [Candidatus Paceibacterota bacterium]